MNLHDEWRSDLMMSSISVVLWMSSNETGQKVDLS